MAPFRCREAGNGGGYTPPLRTQKRRVGVRQGKVGYEAGERILAQGTPFGCRCAQNGGGRRDVGPVPYGDAVAGRGTRPLRGCGGGTDYVILSAAKDPYPPAPVGRRCGVGTRGASRTQPPTGGRWRYGASGTSYRAGVSVA